MIVKLLTEHHLEFLSLKEGCRGSSESTLVKMSNCWKSHAAAHLYIYEVFDYLLAPCVAPQRTFVSLPSVDYKIDVYIYEYSTEALDSGQTCKYSQLRGT